MSLVEVYERIVWYVMLVFTDLLWLNIDLFLMMVDVYVYYFIVASFVLRDDF